MPDKTHTPRDIKEGVHAEIANRLTSGGRGHISIFQNAKLQPTLGLSSLEIVELIETLNEKFGVNPFRTYAVTDLQTVGDLCKIYLDAASGPR